MYVRAIMHTLYLTGPRNYYRSLGNHCYVKIFRVNFVTLLTMLLYACRAGVYHVFHTSACAC